MTNEQRIAELEAENARLREAIGNAIGALQQNRGAGVRITNAKGFLAKALKENRDGE